MATGDFLHVNQELTARSSGAAWIRFRHPFSYPTNNHEVAEVDASQDRPTEQELLEKLREALKEENDAWVPVLRKQGAVALNLSSDGPAPDDLIRLKVARRRSYEAMKALRRFIAVQRPDKD